MGYLIDNAVQFLDAGFEHRFEATQQTLMFENRFLPN